jgi:tRNA pseudouridine38-40 synthase
MQAAARDLVGELDFESFRSAQCDAAHARRTVWKVGVSQTRGGIVVEVRGNAFCRNMVRIMVGTLVEVGLGKRADNSLVALLAARDRRLAGVTAPAQGLFLERVFYPDEMEGAEIPSGVRFPRYPIEPGFWPPAD